MANSSNLTWQLRRIATVALLLAVIIQVVTVILLVTDYTGFEVEELHEICGFTILGLVIIHGIFFRKSLKNIVTSKV